MLVKLRYKYAILIVFLFHSYLFSQLPTLEWAQRFPDTNIFNAGANAMVLDNSGNVYVTGYADSSSYLRYCTVKYNSTGARLWTSYFFGSGLGGRYARAIALDSFSNIYVTGYSNNFSTSFDYCTVKYNSLGIQQWVRYYNGPGNGQDEARKIAIDKSGNIYVTGESLLGNFQFATVKYAPDGTELWVRRHGTPDGNTFANGLEIDNSSNIYITGVNNDSSLTIKYDSVGNLLWSAKYCGNAGVTEANNLILDKSNNVYIVGFTTNAPNHRDFFVIKYTTGGLLLWERRFNTDTLQNSIYTANSVGLDSFENVYVSGTFMTNQSAPRRLCTVKYTNTGNLIWEQKDTTILSNQRTLMNIDKKGDVYVAGSTNNLSAYATIKYDSSGNFLWNEKFIVQATSPNSLIVDRNCNIYLSGDGANRMLTIKYSQIVGIEPISSNTPNEFKLHQNYPNPFNPETIIKFQVSTFNFVKLIVYDVLGRELETLVKEALKPGIYQVRYSSDKLTSGVYFYRLATNEYLETKKMVVIK